MTNLLVANFNDIGNKHMRTISYSRFLRITKVLYLSPFIRPLAPISKVSRRMLTVMKAGPTTARTPLTTTRASLTCNELVAAGWAGVTRES